MATGMDMTVQAISLAAALLFLAGVILLWRDDDTEWNDHAR